MATTPPLLSIEEYLHTSYKPDVHFVDGEIEERNVGERTHAAIQSFIDNLFAFNQPAWNASVSVEQRIYIDSSQVRVCDVAVFLDDAPWEEVAVTPPLACIEVLSPTDRLQRAELVLADYFAIGVANIWLIDPYQRIAYRYDGSGLHPVDPASLSIPNTPIKIDLTPVFAKLDRIAAAANRL
jgi:Uma2 family endonuclease